MQESRRRQFDRIPAAVRIRLERVAVRTRFEADRIRLAAVRNDFEPAAVRTRFAGADRNPPAAVRTDCIRFAAVRIRPEAADRTRLEAVDRIRVVRIPADRIRPEPAAVHIHLEVVRIPADRTRLAAADHTD